MDFVPEIIDEAVVLNATDICTHGHDCRPCAELSVGIHNWLVTHKLQYLIVDFQDEKDVCSSILAELLQLKKRLRYPFLFCGMMDGPRKFLKSYAYNDYPFFAVPEEAIAHLRKVASDLLKADLSGIKQGEPIPCTRSRNYRLEEGEEPDEDSGGESES